MCPHRASFPSCCLSKHWLWGWGVGSTAKTWDVDYVVFCEVDANSTQWLEESAWIQGGGGQSQDGKTRVGAIIAQPPPGFGISPPAAYAAKLEALQRLPLVCKRLPARVLMVKLRRLRTLALCVVTVAAIAISTRPPSIGSLTVSLANPICRYADSQSLMNVGSRCSPRQAVR